MTQADVVLVLVTGLQGTGKSATADRVAGALAAPVLAWDWMMGALTPFELVQSALGALDRATYRAVGWALMMQAARAQLQRGLSVSSTAWPATTRSRRCGSSHVRAVRGRSWC